MKVLIACEFSGIVREAFKAKGHDAWSCDLLPTEIPGQHLIGNIELWLNPSYKWDLMIAHPPCTYLAYSGERWMKLPGRNRKRIDAMQFFFKLWNADIEKICIENPHGYPRIAFRKPDQEIHPYYFGERQMKRTCLWLKNLPKLTYSLTDNLFESASATEKPEANYIRKDGNKQYFSATIPANKERGKNRSKFWPSIAKAMAEQWG